MVFQICQPHSNISIDLKEKENTIIKSYCPGYFQLGPISKCSINTLFKTRMSTKLIIVAVVVMRRLVNVFEYFPPKPLESTAVATTGRIASRYKITATTAARTTNN